MFLGNILLIVVAFVSIHVNSCVAMAKDIGVSSIEATYRNGQVFLLWHEEEAPVGSMFNVYAAADPITNDTLSQAILVGHHIEPHSARDWWQDPASFSSGADHSVPVGFIVENNQEPLDPARGLFVHTVIDSEKRLGYFAVTCTTVDGEENRTILPGINSLQIPVKSEFSPIEPIWIGTGGIPTVGCGKGMSLYIRLHGRGGGRTAGPKAAPVNYVVFGDKTMGWREGIPFKFYATITDEFIKIEPYDRAWTSRPIMESRDSRDRCPAVNTWWFGYNSEIYRTTLTEKTVVPNYSERRLLYLVGWAQRYFKTDVNKTYLRGNSMGGSATVSMVLHHPKVFAAAYAEVPAVAYLPGGNIGRLKGVCGPLDDSAVTGQGKPFLEHMNAPAVVAASDADIPPLFMINAKSDKSISWKSKPVFYTAMNQAKQAVCAYWNNAGHMTFRDSLPADIENFPANLEHYRLDQSYPVFTNCSDNRDPGNGKAADGDLVGWINRGLSWKNTIDSPEEYSMTIIADYPGIKLPISVDVTLRRLQEFKVLPGQKVNIQIGDDPPYLHQIDAKGLLSISNISIKDSNCVRLRISKRNVE